MNENEDKVLNINQQLAEQKNYEILRDCTDKLNTKLLANGYQDRPEDLT